MGDNLRVRILCEDRRTERFLRGVCRRFGLQVLDVVVAPSAGGAASAWVAANYPKQVRLLRSKKYQRNLGLIVHIDGDNRGVNGRKADLDGRLTSDQPALAARAPTEAIAVLVPTWCIETWLLHLSGIAQPPESDGLKRDPDTQYSAALHQLDSTLADSIRAAVAAWPGTTPPSLADGHGELQRVL